MQAVLVEAEAVARVHEVILALVTDDGFALQRGDDGVARRAVRGQARARVKGHEHELSSVWTISILVMLPSS